MQHFPKICWQKHVTISECSQNEINRVLSTVDWLLSELELVTHRQPHHNHHTSHITHANHMTMTFNGHI